MKRKNTEKINENLFECPFCSCTFATKSDLNNHLQAWGSNKSEHVRQLDEAHREIDRSFKGTMAKRKGKKRQELWELPSFREITISIFGILSYKS